MKWAFLSFLSYLSIRSSSILASQLSGSLEMISLLMGMVVLFCGVATVEQNSGGRALFRRGSRLTTIVVPSLGLLEFALVGDDDSVSEEDDAELTRKLTLKLALLLPRPFVPPPFVVTPPVPPEVLLFIVFAR